MLSLMAESLIELIDLENEGLDVEHVFISRLQSENERVNIKNNSWFAAAILHFQVTVALGNIDHFVASTYSRKVT